MLCEEPIKAAIWHALNHYAFSDAAFLAERLYAEGASDEALYLLATVYYRSGQAKRSYYLLQKRGYPTAECKFLFAKCCMDLNKHSEAERILTASSNPVVGNKQVETVVSEFGSAASYSLALLGEVCRKAEKTTRAVECFKSSLKHNPLLWSSFETLCKLGEKPNPSEIFKSSSCPRLLTTLTHRDTMTTGSTTTSSENTTLSTDNHVRSTTIEPMATENMDPSWNTPTNTETNQSFTAPSNLHGNNANYVSSPTPMGTSNENRARPKVGRNLLGVSSSASPFSPSFAVLPMDTPSPDPATTYITPSPTINECQLPKAPKARKIGRRNELMGKHPGITTLTTSSSNTTVSQSTSSGVRRSTRLFGSTPTNASLNDSTDKGSRKNNKGEFSLQRGGIAPRKVKTRRQTRSSAANSQPLSPSCSENIIPEPSKPTQTSVHPIKIPVSTTSLDSLLSLYQELGNAYVALTSYECKESLALFEAVQPHHYNTCWVLSQVARNHFELAQYHLAEKVFLQVRHLDPYCLKGMELYSTTLWHLQKEVALSALAQDLVETERVCAEAWAATGNCYSLQKEHDTAIKFFQRAVQVDPSFTYAYTLLGHEYVLTEELDRAMSCFRSAIRTDPRHYNAWYGVGMIYYKQEKYNLAEVHFRKAVEINHSSSVLICHIGVVQHALKRSLTALSTLEKAMQMDPKNPLCKFHRATILFSLERYKETLSELEELRRIVPKEALVYFLMGKAYKKLGDNHQAQMHFSWAVDLDPKGANNQIKEAVDKRYLPEDDDVSIDDVDLSGEGGVGDELNNESRFSDNEDLE
ncbi:cell division cycle protein 27 homolog [Dendronephthya gigantea]|uniref:cell division cycle protein 27 homolog n=1 Tax=Dendronephthya gigantea TaxID=151771 RepID=UPI00106C0F69|nr:cell division cycle protein 27 homolog [Dendronephthya gigantea]